MPWTTKDVAGFTKAAKTAKQKRQWIAVANSALKSCLDDGGSQDDCEASAIRQGNAVVKEDDMSEVVVTVAVPTVAENAKFSQIPKLPPGTLPPSTVVGETLETTDDDTVEETVVVLEPTAKEAEGGLESMAQQVRNAYYAMFRRPVPEMAPINEPWVKEIFSDHPEFGNMIVVDDAGVLYGVPYEVGEDGEITFSDERKKVVQTYIMAEVGKRLNASQIKSLQAALETVQGILIWANYEDMIPEEVVEEKFTESASGRVMGLVETKPIFPDAIVPLRLDAVLIEPGWGNDTDNHYYPREMLERDAEVFVGAKMYATDHRQHEKSTESWVSTIKKISGFTDSGAPIGRISIHKEWFAKDILALNADDLLEKMESSILAGGTAKKGEVDGKKGRIVESITEVDSVDWVTRAGAGGRALALAETEGGSMDEIETEVVEEEEIEEVAISEDEEPETPAPEPLSDEKVTERLGETNLPKASKARLSVEYADEDALEEAVKAEIAYVKELTGSGEPFGMDGGPQEHKPLTEEEKRERYNKRLAEVDGGNV